jgi:O-glycosyl hydrolase
MYFQDLGSSMLRMDLNINALRGSDNDIATPVTMVEDINQNIAQFDFHNSRVQPFGDMAKASLTKKLDDFKLIASIWSPPHWMKGAELDAQSGKLNGN